MDINNIMNEIQRGSAEIIGLERILELVRNFYEKGENYFVKIGLDPTAPDLHLGHTVVLSKMAFLQKHGAIIQFLIGDFTAQIGDPSGKSQTRKKLSADIVLKNAKTYENQVFKILDPQKTQILFNSKWVNKMSAAELIELASTANVARMLERDDFAKRFKSGISISISEFLYPLMQGYDSVVLKSDIEMGGTDQKFNLLMGRNLQRIYGVGKEQSIIMMPLLEGLDGVNKMSKSLGNYIGVTESANEMYAKILSIGDDLMWRYYELLSEKSLGEIENLEYEVKNAKIHPKIAKENLALEIVSKYHSKDLASAAKAEFDSIHSKNEIPSDIKTLSVNGEIWIIKALVDAGLCASNSEARRKIAENAVSLNQNKISDDKMTLEKGEFVLQVGKKKFIKLKVL